LTARPNRAIGAQIKLPYLFTALLSLALFSGCALLPAVNTDRATDGLPTPTPIPTAIVPVKPVYTVQRGEIVKQLEFSGRISPVVEEDLFFRTSGRVRSVFHRRNDMVEAGAIIAELEIEGLERQLETALLDLERAQVRLEQAEANLEFQLQTARTNIEIAQLRLQSAQSEAAPDRTAIAIQEKQIELLELDLDRLKAGVDPLLRSEVTRADLAVQKLRAEIDEARIIAPFDGRLMSLSLTPGQSVNAYVPAAVVADISEFELKADLVSSQMNDLVEGMTAVIFSVQRPGESLPGTVRRLPYPYGSGGRGTTVEDLDKSTRVSIDLPADQVPYQLGDLVRVTVELQRKADVLWLPPQALRIFDGRRFAVLQDGDVQRRVDVKVGIETTDRVEVEEGLDEGQVVVGP
jgi:membrane fusion protein, macrolide-specific efflux system